MEKLSKALEGKKSYIVSLLTAVYTVLQSFEVFVTTPDQDVAVYALFAVLFGASIRDAISKK